MIGARDVCFVPTADMRGGYSARANDLWRSSPKDCWTTSHAPCRARLAMIAATITSGQPMPVPNTPAAASRAAKFPSTSLRVQIQAERILASPSRYAQSRPNDIALAARAAKPIAPIVYAFGNVPWSACHIAVPIIQNPNRPRGEDNAKWKDECPLWVISGHCLLYP